MDRSLSASFQILVNGEPGESFNASNGVRQGDPPAPYLFLIAMEGLSSMLRQAVVKGVISPACAGTTKVSHILYANDIIVFAKNTKEEAEAIKEVFDGFYAISGLKMNPSKSRLMAGRASCRDSVRDCLDIELTELPSTYLGLPLFSGRLTKELCSPLLTKIARRLDSWKSKLLSFAVRLELIISTLSSFHLFWILDFPLPSSVLRDIERMC